MFVINDLPSACPHCCADIPRQQIEEDFYAGSLLTCADCGSTYRYLSTEALTASSCSEKPTTAELAKRPEPPATDKKKTYCVTCTQVLPAGMKHPEFFGQNLLTPDPSNLFDIHTELEFTLSDLHTISDVLMELYTNLATQHQDSILFGLYGMLCNYTEEAQRRAIRLRNAGLYWKRDLDDRNDESLFPDLPPPCGRRTEP